MFYRTQICILCPKEMTHVKVNWQIVNLHIEQCGAPVGTDSWTRWLDFLLALTVILVQAVI